MNKKTKIFMAWTLNAGTSFYRMINFMKYMQDDFSFGYSKWTPDHQGVADWEYHMRDEKVKEDIMRLTSECDIAIAQKFHTRDGIIICDILRDFYKTKKFYTEMDDNVFLVNPDSPAYGDYQPGSENVLIVKEQIQKSNGMIVSTEHLARVYREYNKNVHVIPNAIDFEIWDTLKKKTKKSKKIRIGWAGGGSHDRDLLMISNVIDAISKKYSNVEFYFLGGFPAEFQEKSQRKLTLSKTWYSINKYPQALKDLNFDIALAPIRDNEFNRAKSNLRWLEYSAMGVPTIASNVEPYKCIEQFVDGMKVESEEDWIDAISTLIESESMRKTIGHNAYNRVKKEFNAEKIAGQYAALIKKIV
jgi:glycosyltransferase involved in cell wall biosynthesis